MLDNINILKVASALARHSAQRHSVLAENIANADTANYKAKDLESFTDSYSRMSDRNGLVRSGLSNDMKSAVWQTEEIKTTGVASPNGNTVSIEDQMMRSIEAQQDHDAALTIYKKTIDLLRTSLGRGA